MHKDVYDWERAYQVGYVVNEGVGGVDCSNVALTPLTKPPGKIARFHPCLIEKIQTERQ